MIVILDQVTVLQFVRVMIWVGVCSIPVFCGYWCGILAETRSGDLAISIWWIGVGFQTTLICCFYFGVIK